MKSKDDKTEQKVDISLQNGSIQVLDDDILSEITQDQDHSDSTFSKEEFHPGLLEITVQRARDLVDNDRISQSDPYVILKYKEVEFRSETISNNLNPEWNFSSSFEILNMEEKYIHINVYDDDFGRDKDQGCYSLPLEMALNQLTEAGQWFSLAGCQSGEIFISSQFSQAKFEKTFELTDEPSFLSTASENTEKEIEVLALENTEEENEAMIMKEPSIPTTVKDSKVKSIF